MKPNIEQAISQLESISNHSHLLNNGEVEDGFRQAGEVLLALDVECEDDCKLIEAAVNAVSALLPNVMLSPKLDVVFVYSIMHCMNVFRFRMKRFSRELVFSDALLKSFIILEKNNCFDHPLFVEIRKVIDIEYLDRAEKVLAAARTEFAAEVSQEQSVCLPAGKIDILLSVIYGKITDRDQPIVTTASNQSNHPLRQVIDYYCRAAYKDKFLGQFEDFLKAKKYFMSAMWRNMGDDFFVAFAQFIKNYEPNSNYLFAISDFYSPHFSPLYSVLKTKVQDQTEISSDFLLTFLMLMRFVNNEKIRLKDLQDEVSALLVFASSTDLVRALQLLTVKLVVRSVGMDESRVCISHFPRPLLQLWVKGMVKYDDLAKHAIQPNLTTEEMTLLYKFPEVVCRFYLQQPAGFLRDFLNFKAAYKHSNAKANLAQKQSFRVFLGKYADTLTCLHEVLGDDAMALLKSFLGLSALALTRFIDNLPDWEPGISRLLSILYKRHKKRLLANKSDCLLFFNALKVINLIATTAPSDALVQLTDEAINVEESLDALLKRLENICFLYLLNSLKMDPALLPQCAKLTPEEIVQIILARKNISNKKLADVFDEQLRADLLSPTHVERFLLDRSQSSAIGAAIASHNYGIVSTLKSHQINVDQAVRYKREARFSTGLGDVHRQKLRKERIVWDDIWQLHRRLQSCDPALVKQLPNGLLKRVNAILHEILKGKENKTLPQDNMPPQLSEEKLAKFNDLSLQNAIKKLLVCARGVPDTQEFRGIVEFVEHLEDHFKELQHEEVTTVAEETAQEYSSTYVVQQWDKTRLATINLGNWLSCCLDINRGWFHALVERRLDIGMMMHVVVDEKTNEPVCGNWLYFAKDHDGKIYVVANFCEIRSSYAHKGLAQKLVKELSDFTSQYAEFIGAAGFLIAQLRYGSIPEFSQWCRENITAVERQLFKVGGFFRDQEYYLASLSERKFHLYQHKLPVLQESDVPSVLPLDFGKEVVVREVVRRDDFRRFEKVSFFGRLSDAVAESEFRVRRSRLHAK